MVKTLCVCVCVCLRWELDLTMFPQLLIWARVYQEGFASASQPNTDHELIVCERADQEHHSSQPLLTTRGSSMLINIDVGNAVDLSENEREMSVAVPLSISRERNGKNRERKTQTYRDFASQQKQPTRTHAPQCGCNPCGTWL